MHTGAFPMLYFIFAVVVLIAASYVLKTSDKTDVSLLPPVPSEPDPIEIAYLAGGENNVIRTVLYGLQQRGFIQVDAKSHIQRTQKAASQGELTLIEQHILDAVKSSPAVRELFRDKVLRSAIQEACASVRARLDAQQLLLPQAVTQTAKRVLWIGLGALIGVTLIKVLLTLPQARMYTVFPLILTVIASGYLLARVKKITSSITSRRGSAFLARLNQAYSGRKLSAAGAFDGASLFLIGLYGFALLRGTPDEHIAKAFDRGSDVTTAACGAGGCGGGGGCCGSGCGGCGGGGS
jgi:uncharacterized protein (TIGR04222 family)